MKGSIPGVVGSLIQMYDSKRKQEAQFKMLPYPTFVPEANKVYPDVMIWKDTIDLNEQFTHDNDEVLGVSDEEEEGEPEKTAEDDITVKK